MTDIIPLVSIFIIISGNLVIIASVLAIVYFLISILAFMSKSLFKGIYKISDETKKQKPLKY